MLTLTTDAFVLLRRPSTSDAFQALSMFSGEHGELFVLQRVSKSRTPRKGGAGAALDLFNEVAVTLESPNQGRTWFVREARVLRGATGIGKSYEALKNASEFAALVARNAVAAESRARVHALLRQAFGAFAGAPRPDVAFVKSVYCLARDEGYPVRQQWMASLGAADREALATLLNKPLAEQTAGAGVVAGLRESLLAWLRAETEILADPWRA